MLTNKKIGVLMGGVSAEREVSLKSGNAVFNALKYLGYNAVTMDVTSNVCEVIKRERIELAFIALHGGWGENGAIQGLLETMGIPYTWSGVLASALAMDKEASKKVFLYHRIPIAPFVVVSRKAITNKTISKAPSPSPSPAGGEGNNIAPPLRGGDKGEGDLCGFTNELLSSNELSAVSFKMPWVVKPVSEGSSVGVSMVTEKEKFMPAVQEAFQYGDRVLVEKYIKGKEVQIGILGDKSLGGVEVRPSDEFYTYRAKYTGGVTEYILPPELGPETYGRVQETALNAYKALGCSGAARVDLIVDDFEEIYVLEVNTVPGMTETSLLPKIAKAAGLDFPTLVEEILREAMNRKFKVQSSKFKNKEFNNF
ncbi:MAG: D-alanine--D-alanine ligase [Nitrospirae bacterium]|nr:D-alanine--D-alanine ligase [Nitrospirota bacterium]